MTAIVRQQPFQLAPTNFAEAERFARMIASSAFAPKGYQGKHGDVMVAMQMGAELGLSPMQALTNIAVVNGRPSLWGDAMPAICMAHPAFVSLHEDVTETVATCTVERRGMPPVVRTFSVDDAKKAALWGKQGPWQQYPKRMLQMRARGFALRDAFPDALRGLISREEAEDIPRETVRATVVRVRPVPEAEQAGILAELSAEEALPRDPIHQAMHEEMSKPREFVVSGDPDDYVVPTGKNRGKMLRALGSDALSWYAERSPDFELKHYAQAALEARIARETSANQAEIETLTENDGWGMSGEQAEVAT